jgi:CelD/BcsL family acetyltransferase involved in cellulose biosynthesis
MAQLTVSQCDTLHDFESLRGEWNDLLDRSTGRSVFLRWEWLSGWWRNLGQDSSLLVLAVREASGTLAGIAPLCIRRTGRGPWSRTVTFLGTTFVSSEYLDLIAAPGLEEAVAATTWSALLERSAEWDYISLTDLRDSSVALRHWSALASAARFVVERAPCQECPYIELPRTLDEFWKRLSPTMRATVRRRTRKLEEVGVRYETIQDPGRIATTLDTLYDLHEQRWATRDMAGKFRHDAVRRFHKELATTMGDGARQRLGTLSYGERVIGALYWLEYAGVVSFYQMGYQPASPDARLSWSYYSPGMVLLGRCMQDAVTNGFSEFDFLRGYETYKRRWTESWRPTWALTLIPSNRLMTRGLLRLDGWIRASKRRVRRLLPQGEQHG